MSIFWIILLVAFIIALFYTLKHKDEIFNQPTVGEVEFRREFNELIDKLESKPVDNDEILKRAAASKDEFYTAHTAVLEELESKPQASKKKRVMKPKAKKPAKPAAPKGRVVK